jgi:hypothetical protein
MEVQSPPRILALGDAVAGNAGSLLRRGRVRFVVPGAGHGGRLGGVLVDPLVPLGVRLASESAAGTIDRTFSREDSASGVQRCGTHRSSHASGRAVRWSFNGPQRRSHLCGPSA